MRGPEPHEPEQRMDPRCQRVAFREPMQQQRLRQDVEHAHAWIERGIGILEDDLHLPPLAPEIGSGERQDALARQPHVARRRLDQAQREAAERGLAAARFADKCQRLAPRQREGDLLHRLHDLAPAEPEQPPAHGEVAGDA